MSAKKIPITTITANRGSALPTFAQFLAIAIPQMPSPSTAVPPVSRNARWG